MNILALGIHPDDIELGCGGTVTAAAMQSHHVTLVDLADGAASSNGTVDERAEEARAAAAIMGVAKRSNLGFVDAGIQSENLDQLAALVEIIREERPVLVLAPSADDPHPDHSSGGKLIQRACYMAGVHGYQRSLEGWRPKYVLVYPGRVDIEPDLVVDITAAYETKIAAIRTHVTQFEPAAHRTPTPLNAPEFLPAVEARARLHGARIGVRYGEAFLSTRPLPIVELGALFAS